MEMLFNMYTVQFRKLRGGGQGGKAWSRGRSRAKTSSRNLPANKWRFVNGDNRLSRGAPDRNRTCT
jgi:hypothetical protein